MSIRDPSIGALLDAIAAKQPTPGGGAVAALTASLGAALGAMVVGYSVGRRSLEAHAELHEEALARLAPLQLAMLDLADADADAYGRLNALWKRPADDEERAREMPGAVREAIAVPRRVLEASLELLELIHRLCGRSSRMLASDLAIAGILGGAAARAAAWNVRINLPQLDDRAEAGRVDGEVAQMLVDASRLVEEIESACRPAS